MDTILGNAFPDDPIVGEEDSADLRKEEGKTLRDRVVQLANESLAAELSHGDDSSWGIGPGKIRTSDQLLDAIDRGSYSGSRNGSA